MQPLANDADVVTRADVIFTPFALLLVTLALTLLGIGLILLVAAARTPWSGLVRALRERSGMLAWGSVIGCLLLGYGLIATKWTMTGEPELRASSELPSPMRMTEWKTRATTSDAPAWAKTELEEAAAQTDPLLATSSSQWFATVQEAESQGSLRLLTRLHAITGSRWPPLSNRDVSGLQAFFTAHYPPESWLETQTKDFGNGHTARMYRAHYRIQLTPDWPMRLAQLQMAIRTESALIAIGSWFLLATLLFSLFAGYVRFRRHSHPAHRLQLGTATGALMLAVTCGLGWMLLTGPGRVLLASLTL